jgi:hypothetical protein
LGQEQRPGAGWSRTGWGKGLHLPSQGAQQSQGFVLNLFTGITENLKSSSTGDPDTFHTILPSPSTSQEMFTGQPLCAQPILHPAGDSLETQPCYPTTGSQ